MKNVRVIHWRPEESEPLLAAVREAGFRADYLADVSGAAISAAIRESVPDAVVIDLTRLPGQGREAGAWLRGRKATRHVPLIFVDGDPAKVELARKLLPDAVFTVRQGIAEALAAAIGKAASGVAPPVVPAPIGERYQGRTAAQKMGIRPDSRAAVVDPPRGYAGVIGPLPEGAELVEDAVQPQPVTLWFLHDPDSFLSALPRMRALAPKTKLWVLWRKGQTNGITQNFVREAGIEAGLVDYKICSVDGVWSGIAFARKKA